MPVLTLVIYTNVTNIQKNKESPTPTPVQTVEKPIIIEKMIDSGKNPEVIPTSSPNCQKQIGPVSISFPSEGEVVKDNPVCIIIKYDDPKFCSVVWSYRINNGSWSEYNSNSVCLYDMPKGNVKFDLRVQSTASQDQTTLTRNFEYEERQTQLPPQLFDNYHLRLGFDKI